MPAEFKNRITLEEALQLLNALKGSVAPLALQPEKAIGLFCAEDVKCKSSVPPFPVSMVDGYAVSATDRNRFLVVHSLGPGEMGPSDLPLDNALKVSTGSYLPKNVCCVVPLENSRADGDYVIVDSFPPETNIMPAGFDCNRNEVVCSAGERITHKKAFFLKWIGVQVVKVLPKPRVSIISVGSELVSGEVPNTNYMVLSGIIEDLGASPSVAQPVPDDIRAIAEAILSALKDSDAVVTSGGSSVGERDLVVDAVKLLNGTVLFHGLKLRPGRTGGVAVIDGKPLIITSGNIQASVIETMLLLSKSLEAMGYPTSIKRTYARIDNDIKVNGPDDFGYVIWVKLYNIQNELFARTIEAMSTSRRVVERADGFVIIKGNYIKKNSIVEVFLL